MTPVVFLPGYAAPTPKVVGSAPRPPAGLDAGFPTPADAVRGSDQVELSDRARLLSASLRAQRDQEVLAVVDQSLDTARARREEARARQAERDAQAQRAAEAQAQRERRLAEAQADDQRRARMLEETEQRRVQFDQRLAEQQRGTLIDLTA